MTENTQHPGARFARVLAIVGLLTVCYGSVAAQTAKTATNSLDVDKNSAEDGTGFASLDEELRAKRAIKFAEKEYQGNLDRARNLSLLGTVINVAFKQKSFLGPEDLKKLEKAEKLTKSIRNAAGGSDDEARIENPPKDLASALGMFEDLTQSLKNKVEKTPKHVVSAAVIDDANVLLELIRMVRTFSSKA